MRLYDQAIEKNKPSVKQYKKNNQHHKNTPSVDDKPCQQASLKTLDGSSHTPLSEGIPYTRQDYFELVD
ncbi:MAG: hypothetical protein KUG83_07780 [Gammaproteobacteria bacterium]|nr:hypothetical protein [Gammaproteobacteria bacterium]